MSNIGFIYFASFTGYEDDIFEVTSHLHIQGSKFGGKFEKFGGNIFLNPAYGRQSISRPMRIGAPIPQ